ncbi:sialate O-acetylesterase [Paenibacillus sp. V4I5]|uniref:sialate O-acetylesterase n=1 Tax=Paenibacillus sp. V4I5 TaxID=3042306 RepID=UPI0027D8D081|nr:sialate O-acetylesterase [Paenibacillus sp. V4I5]
MEGSRDRDPLRNMNVPGEIRVEGPSPQRVYQRDAMEQADIPFSLRLSKPAYGNVEVCSVAAKSMPAEKAWISLGVIRNMDSFDGVLAGLSTGSHCLQFRIRDGVSEELIAEAAVEPVFVGDLWILAGQSNMQGCGTLLEVEEPMEGVSSFYLDDSWGIAEDPMCWYFEAVDPVHWSVPAEKLQEARLKERQTRTRGAGLGISFGKELLRSAGVPVGLIVCAHGGTRMTQWDPAFLEQEGHSLYGSMLRRVKVSGGKVKGCLWYQGESDANPEHASMYAQRMEQFVRRLREDLQEPQLPFIYAQLANFHSWDKQHESCWDFIQDEQFRLEQRLAPCALVPTADSTMSDPIHLDASSLKVMGRRFAWQALRIAYGASLPTGPRPSDLQWNADRTELTVRLTGLNGSLQQVDRAFGFQIKLVDQVWEPAEATLSDDRWAVLLRFNEHIPTAAMLQYGAGYYPALNLRDEWGIPLPLFGPLLIP